MLQITRQYARNWIYQTKHALYFTRMVHTDALNIRNIALTAHIGSVCNFVFNALDLIYVSIDSGKTTLTESILHASEYVSTPGSVDSGSTTTDFLPAERERGITIQSASIPIHWKNWSFNLIDTPGHADFGMEVESASRIVDGAVVLLDGVEGVEAQTKGVWSQLNKRVICVPPQSSF
jgi:small GTP-binding protein